VLSGIGGDEVTGGVPTPLPEIADLMRALRVGPLASRLKQWALIKRRPWFHLLLDAGLGFLPDWVIAARQHAAPWLDRAFAEKHHVALAGYSSRMKWFGPLPSFQQNIFALDTLRRELGCAAAPVNPPYERRYPFLDRDLLEFLFALPREQILRPGQRRSLLRRALRGIVPDEVLNRRRKAFASRAPLIAVATSSAQQFTASERMISVSLGWIDPDAFRLVIEKSRNGQEIPTVTVLRTLCIEEWLRATRELLSIVAPSGIEAAPREQGSAVEFS
jgi:asparagine synthase (glutamine-hydrolysing)